MRSATREHVVLLQRMFRPSELVVLLVGRDRRDLLPPSGIPDDEWFLQLVDRLEALGEVNPTWFGLLVREQPRWRIEIDALAELYRSPI